MTRDPWQRSWSRVDAVVDSRWSSRASSRAELVVRDNDREDGGNSYPDRTRQPLMDGEAPRVSQNDTFWFIAIIFEILLAKQRMFIHIVIEHDSSLK